MQQALPKMLLTAREAAALLSISERTLWTLTSTKAIPCVRLSPRMTRYDPDMLDDWIKNKQSAVRKTANR